MNKSNQGDVRFIQLKLQTSPNKIKDLNKWKDIFCVWIRTLDVVKILHKGENRFKAIPIKISMHSFFRYRKTQPQIHIEFQGIQKGQIVLKWKNEVERLTCTHFKTYCIATGLYWHQGNGAKSPEITRAFPNCFSTRCPRHSMRREVSLTDDAWRTGHPRAGEGSQNLCK